MIESLNDMDLELEISNHLDWIDTVASLINEETLDESDYKELTDHDHCALGQWMNSEDSSELWDLEEFKALSQSHEKFHNLAGDMVAFIQQGKAEQALSTEEQFIQASQEVVQHLQALHDISSPDT